MYNFYIPTKYIIFIIQGIIYKKKHVHVYVHVQINITRDNINIYMCIQLCKTKHDLYFFMMHALLLLLLLLRSMYVCTYVCMDTQASIYVSLIRIRIRIYMQIIHTKLTRARDACARLMCQLCVFTCGRGCV